MTASSAQPIELVRCADCGRIDTPARAVCSGCLSAKLEPHCVAGEGAIISWTTIHRAPTRFKDEAPYDVVVVDLDSGVRMTGRLDASSPPPAVGARVRALRSQGPGAVFLVEGK
jgi:uncharacterized OB-fold protein